MPSAPCGRIRPGLERDSRRHFGEDRSRRRSRRRENVRAEEPEAEGRADLGLVPREVAARDEASGALLRLGDVLGDGAAIEAVLAAVADRLEGLREVRLAEQRSGRGGSAARQEDARGLGIARESLPVGGDRLRDVGGHRESVAGEADGRLDDDLPREAAGAAMREGEPGDRAGDTGSERAFGRRGAGRSAGGEEEVAPGGTRGDLAEIHHQGAPLRVARDPESSAGDVPRLGPGDGEGEGDRDRGVRGVASAAQDLDADLGGGGLLGRDASAGPERGLRQVGAGERGGRREGEQDCREPPFHCAILPAR